MTRRRSVDLDALALTLTADLLRSKSLVDVVAASAGSGVHGLSPAQQAAVYAHALGYVVRVLHLLGDAEPRVRNALDASGEHIQFEQIVERITKG